MTLTMRRLANAAAHPRLVLKYAAQRLPLAHRLLALKNKCMGMWRQRGGVSVIIPVYNSAEYLDECLESIWRQKLPKVRVIAVDDGSTDDSADVLAKHRTAHNELTVITQANKGPGAARNAGIRCCKTKYLTFVDADDYLPPNALEVLLDTLTTTKSDFVVGATARVSGGKFTVGPVDKMLHAENRLKITIEEFPEIIYDCITANKMYRTKFWRGNIGQFPENQIYEDQVVSALAYTRAKQFDVIARRTYYWRSRGDRTSITQTVEAANNLRDRRAIQRQVATIIASANSEELLEAWIRLRIIGHDVKLYAKTITGMSSSRYQLLRDWVGEFVGRGSSFFTKADVVGSAYAWLIMNAERSDVEEFLENMEASRGTYGTLLEGECLYALLPLPDHLLKSMPKEVLAIGLDQCYLRSNLRNLTWIDATTLKLSGWAFINLVDSSAVNTRIKLIAEDSVSGQRYEFHVEPNHQLPVTETSTTRWLPYDLAGFDCYIDIGLLSNALPSKPRFGVAARWEITAEVSAGALVRRGPIRRPAAQGGARSPASSIGRDGIVTAPVWDGDSLVLEVIRKAITLTQVRSSGRTLNLRGFAHIEGVESIFAVARDKRRQLRADQTLTIGPDGAFAISLAIPSLAGKPRSDVPWAIRARLAKSSVPLHWEESPYAGLQILTCGLLARRSRRGNLILTENSNLIEITSVTATEYEIKYELAVNGFDVVDAHLRSTLARVGVETIERTQSRLVVTFSRFQTLWGTAPRPLPIGAYELSISALGSDDQTPRTITPRMGHSLALTLPRDLTANGLRFWTTPKGILRTQVRGQRTHDEIGPYHQARLQRTTYSYGRVDPPAHSVLFESFQGHYATCNPLAISEELRRRRTDLAIYWSVTDLSVAVPEGTTPLVRLSEAWYKELARAKYVVNNNTWPSFYRKSDYQVLLQTWHGTPLKRICHDFNDRFLANYRRYLNMLDRESATWDYLISPNKFSSPIFRGAFAYDGEILETGYPRNDAIVRADQGRVARFKSWYGIPDGVKVVLYAPTWRANRFKGSPGRYERVLYLQTQAASELLGSDYVILVRGHSKTLTHGSNAAGDRVIDVTNYPDINDLYLVADVLVTDYSSVMFDFAITGKPILFLTPDLASYRDDIRGFYFELSELSPGPLLNSTREVVEAIQQIDSIARDYKLRYLDFAASFTSLEDGKASARVVDAVFGSRGDA